MKKRSTTTKRKTGNASSKQQKRRPATRNGFSKIRSAVKQLEQVREKARRLGLFVEDRELLSCQSCGLEEDVTTEGVLIVTNQENRRLDTGLRFSAVNEDKGLFRCPGCGKDVMVPDSALP